MREIHGIIKMTSLPYSEVFFKGFCEAKLNETLQGFKKTILLADGLRCKLFS